MKTRTAKSLLSIAALTAAAAAPAADTDLFALPRSSGDAPNVLLVLDNAANFSSNASGTTCIIDNVPTALSGTVGGIEQCALYSVVSGLSTASDKLINLGMMVYNAGNVVDHLGVECPNPLGGSRTGGCLVYPMVPLTAENKTAFLAWVKSWKTTGNGAGYLKANNQSTGAVMQEAWAYFSGRTGLSGRSYAGAMPASMCGNNYVIFIGNSFSSAGQPGDQTGEKGPKSALEGTNPLLSGGMNANPAATSGQRELITGTIDTSYKTSSGATATCGTFNLSASNHENNGFYGDEWARYMRGQGITTYTIGLLGPSCQASYAALLMSKASDKAGGGKYFPTNDFAGLEIAFQTVFSEVQTRNSAFASVSLPVSVNTQGTYLNQVYVGMFRPAEHFLPRWMGNLKQYRMGFHNGQFKLLDASAGGGQPAISGGNTGFISECARSYWTPVNSDEYWTSITEPNCTGHPASSNTPDGNVVEKGAQGYMLRATDPSVRNVKTCDAGCTGVASFNTDNAAITKAGLGNASMADAERNELIEWARGANNKTADESIVAATAMRPSAHGDVVHSRPVAINYGTDGSPQVVVFYGSNDGTLRAVNGNRDGGNNVADVSPGNEIWSFIPPEFYGHIKRLRENSQPVSFRGTTVSTSADKPYGFDGPVAGYRDSSRTWIFASMRRGGRALYAFNVTSPGEPALLWKRGCPTNFDGESFSDTGCSGVGADPVGGISQDMSSIGQTWSSPKVLKASGYRTGAAGTEKPILIFGGGYDTCEDYDVVSSGVAYNHNCASTTRKGRRIFVLDAESGTVLKALPTERGVVGDVTVVPDATGLAKYAYAADLGGNLYRITIGNLAPSAWTITKIASLGCASTGTCNANRKFLFGPDVVEENGTFFLLVGSGDREKPLASYTAGTSVTNYFFMVKDRPSDTDWLAAEQSSGNCPAAASGDPATMCLESLLPISSGNPDSTALAGKKGWYLSLRASEQVVTSAVTLFGTVTFSTHMPPVRLEGACTSDLGEASVYNIRYLNAATANGTTNRYETIFGGGLAPSPVAGRVTLDDGTTVPFVIGANPRSALEGGVREGAPSSSVIQPKVRVYWYLQQ